LFSQIVNQEKAKRFLKRVIAGQRIPHAYLFTGIPGVGKTTTALALASALNCRKPVEGEACGQCPSCKQIRSGTFPDFLLIKPDGQNIKISQIRELNRALSFAPVLGGYRVCVIHQAETMTEEAANSLLKILEEPPPSNILILKAAESLDLLPTIVSRCQRVSFQPLPFQDMTRWLLEERALDQDSAMVLARISGGSLGRAIKMCEGNFFEKRQDWLLKLMELPGISNERVVEMALELADKAKKKSSGTTEPWEADIPSALEIWESWYRDLLVLMTGGPTHLLINVDFSHKLKNFSSRIKIDWLMESLLAIEQAQRDLRRMRNTSLVLEHTLLCLKRLHG